MPVATFPLGPLQTNSYILHTQKNAIVVDAGGDPAPMLDYLKQHGLNLDGIFVTHRHFDHIYGVADLARATGAPIYVPAADDMLTGTDASTGGNWGFPPVKPFENSPMPSGSINVAGTECVILQTPGHTPGGVSLHFPAEKIVFSGDALFYRSIGRTDFLGGDQNTLLNSIHKVLFALPEETIVYPGHGPTTTIGQERRENPFCGEA